MELLGPAVFQYLVNIEKARTPQHDARNVLEPTEGFGRASCLFLLSGKMWKLSKVIPVIQQRPLLFLLSANLELSLANETAGSSGYLVSVPDDGESDTIDKMRARVANLKGRTAFVKPRKAGVTLLRLRPAPTTSP